MAKIIGALPKGLKISGFVHYSLPDVAEPILRRESGITKDNYKQKRYQKTREKDGRGALYCLVFWDETIKAGTNSLPCYGIVPKNETKTGHAPENKL